MKILNIVYALLLFACIQVAAQQKPVPVDAKLKGEWQIKSVAVEKYHMQQGTLLGKEEVSGYDSISRIGGVLLNIEFRERYCLIKQVGNLNAWEYVRADSGILELKRTTASGEAPPDKGAPGWRLPYLFDSHSDLYVGPLTFGYMDKSSGTPVKMKYVCHYIRTH